MRLRDRGEKQARKRWFAVATVLAMVVVAAACGLALIATGNVGITSAVRPADRYGAVVPAYQSPGDRDGDGVDDQSDILESALAYVQTRPRYRSVYYAGGYPDDGRGVCTDVVAFALRGAGFDLRALMDAMPFSLTEDQARARDVPAGVHRPLEVGGTLVSTENALVASAGTHEHVCER